MPTDQYGFPIQQGQVEGEEWQMLRIPSIDPLVPIMEDLQTLTNALAIKDSMSPIEPSLARMMMLMGT